MNNSPFPPHIQLSQMISSYWVSQSIYVASKLNIADLLKNKSLSCQELANILIPMFLLYTD